MDRRQVIKKGLGVGAGLLATAHAPLWAQAIFSSNQKEYLIVGGGAAGATMASLLVQAGKSVVLLEAGGDQVSKKVDVPAYHPLSTEDEDISWHFYVHHYADREREKKDWKYVPHKGILYPRAQGLGGCTLHHAMVTHYPSNRDWQNLNDLTGDTGFDPRTMRSYYDKMKSSWLPIQQNDLGLIFQDHKLMDIALSSLDHEGMANELAEIAFNKGVGLNPNSKSSVAHQIQGVFNTPKATKNGHRNGPRELLLETKKKFPELLTIITRAHVTKILFAPGSNKAIGVEYIEGSNLYGAAMVSGQAKGPKKEIYCSNEVILAGGAFNSPQLLQLSGIGEKRFLQSMGIDCRVDLPGVGHNLQDRYEMGVVTELKEPFNLLKDCRYGELNDPCLKDYEINPDKSFYSTNGVVISLIKKSSVAGEQNDLYVFGVPGEFKGYYPGWSKTCLRQKNLFTWLILKGYTENTAGRVSIKSKNPFETPDIHFNYFDDGSDRSQKDLQAMKEGMDIARSLNKIPGMSKNINAEIYPGSHSNDLDMIKNDSWGHHASCSNKMGRRDDSTAVVDSQGRVHGTQGLRVVDASIFPKIPGLFIVLPIYQMTYKISQDIIRGKK